MKYTDEEAMKMYKAIKRNNEALEAKKANSDEPWSHMSLHARTFNIFKDMINDGTYEYRIKSKNLKEFVQNIKEGKAQNALENLKLVLEEKQNERKGILKEDNDSENKINKIEALVKKEYDLILKNRLQFPENERLIGKEGAYEHVLEIIKDNK